MSSFDLICDQVHFATDLAPRPIKAYILGTEGLYSESIGFAIFTPLSAEISMTEAERATFAACSNRPFIRVTEAAL